MKTIQQLLERYEPLRVVGSTNKTVVAITADSRNVAVNGLFIAVKGTQTDGHNYIEKVVKAGVSAVVCEVLPAEPAANVTWIVVDNSLKYTGLLASAFYGYPSELLKLVGVTGTNGKTTTASLLYKMFSRAGFSCGLLSTVRNYIGNEMVEATHTTPDPVQLNALLNRMVEAGCGYCFMEVSSHAVDQYRIAGLDFDGAVFTNLTRDHLDYHGTFANYRDCKKRFFDGLKKTAFALVNNDDKNGGIMLQNCAASKYTYSVGTPADFRAKIIESRLDGTLITINDKELWVSFAGRFNVYNLTAVFAASRLLGLSETDALLFLSAMQSVEGRFETISSAVGVTAIVDYAHTPDALVNVISTIADVMQGEGRLLCVVGAGGNRDKGKRPLMAAESVKGSQLVILTSDNPRFEEPEDIIADMMAGVNMVDKRKVLCITDRTQAIRTALTMAQPGDVVLIAGKGHETYQDVKGVKHHFDDREVVREFFNQLN